jgi:hypothetical protein
LSAHLSVYLDLPSIGGASFGVVGKYWSSSLTLSGFVSQSEDQWTEAKAVSFSGSKVRLQIVAPNADPKWKQFAADEGLEHVCGWIKINANREAKTFEFDDEDGFGPPINVLVAVEPDMFNTLQRQIAEADRRQRSIGARLDLSGKSLPEKTEAMEWLTLTDLVHAEPRQYAVVGFQVYERLEPRRFTNRIISPSKSPAPTTVLSVRLDDTTLTMDMERGLISQIRCNGSLIVRDRKSPLNGAEVSVNFQEHELNWSTRTYPEEAHAGGFTLYPPKDGLAYHCVSGLCFTNSDALTLISPLLVQTSPYDGIFLHLTILISDEELCSAKQAIDADVGRYSVEIVRRLTRAPSIIGAGRL